MEIELEGVDRLRFADGSPVRAASAVTQFGDGFLVVPDDATHGAWFRQQAVTAVRLLPPVEGLEEFEEASGTKHLKPDLEAALQVPVDDEPAVLMLGSGSSPARMRWSLLRMEAGEPRASVAAMTPVYAAVAHALGVEADVLNLEGACLVGDHVRWFQRGLPSAGLPSGSVDLPLAGVVAAALGQEAPGVVEVTNPRHYDLGAVGGVGLAITDTVVLPGGGILASAAAEDSADPRDDGPVVGTALVRLEGHTVEDVSALPHVDGSVVKVEGLMVLEADDRQARLLGVADVDDHEAPSLALRLRVRW